MPRHILRCAALAVLAVASAGRANAQATLASRVAAAPDGVVRLEFDSRPGTCGNGRDVVAYKHSLFSDRYETHGTWSGIRCVPGPLRVTLTVADRRVVGMEAQVGGAWPTTTSRVTDLGSVPPRDASQYLFSLVPQLESTTRNSRMLLPAVLADDARVTEPLLALARSDSRTRDTRQRAIQWLGLLGDASVVPALVEFASTALARSAVSALSFLDGGVGIPALIDLTHTGATDTRRDAVFWLGQSGDPRALRTLHAVIEDTKEDSRVRAHAIFSIANSDESPASEYTWLRSAYSRLDDDKMKEAVFQAMAQDRAPGGAQWLIDRARDVHEPTRLRRQALFWAGQGDATSTADILGVYRDADNRDLREHAIFVLSQRKDDAATDALIHIARSDDDSRMRGKALFWLAQKHDSRVTKLIADMLK